jgi:hypothetical protein
MRDMIFHHLSNFHLVFRDQVSGFHLKTPWIQSLHDLGKSISVTGRTTDPGTVNPPKLPLTQDFLAVYIADVQKRGQYFIIPNLFYAFDKLENYYRDRFAV